ncbi:hypothetical protein NU195Hw_Modified_146t1 [Hortaea werneckii]
MGAAAATATAGGQGGVYQDRYGGYWEMDCGYYFSGSPYYDGAYVGTNGIGVYSCFNGCANRPGCVGFTYYGTSTGPATGAGRCFHFFNGQQGNLNYNTTYLFPDNGGYSLFGSAYLLQANENLLCPTYNGTYFLDAQGQVYYILCGYGSTSQYQNTAARDGPACLALCDAQAQCIGVTVVYGGAESNANNNANCYLASAGLNTIANTRNVLAVRTTMPSFVPTTTTTTTTTSSTTPAAASSTCTFAVSPTGLPTNCGGRSSTASFLGVYNDTCGVTYSIYCHVESNPQQADSASASSISACMALCDNYVFADNSTCQSATLYQGRCYLKRSFDGFRDASTDTTVMVRNSNQNLLLANSSSTTASPTTSTATVPYSTTLSAYTSYQPTNTWTINSGSCASGMGPAAATATAGGQGGVYTDIYNSYWEMDCDYAFSGTDNYDGATTGSGTGSLGVYGCFNGCAQRPNCIGFSYYGTQSEPARGAGRCYFYGAGQQGDLAYSPTAGAPQATTTPIYGSSYLLQGSPVNMCPYWHNQYYVDSSNVTYYIMCGSDGTGNQTYDGSLQTSYTGTSYSWLTCLQSCSSSGISDCSGVTYKYTGLTTNPTIQCSYRRGRITPDGNPYGRVAIAMRCELELERTAADSNLHVLVFLSSYIYNKLCDDRNFYSASFNKYAYNYGNIHRANHGNINTSSFNKYTNNDSDFDRAIYCYFNRANHLHSPGIDKHIDHYTNYHRNLDRKNHSNLYRAIYCDLDRKDDGNIDRTDNCHIYRATNGDNDGHIYRATNRDNDGHIYGKDHGNIYRAIDRDYDGHIYGKDYGDIYRAINRDYDGDINRANHGTSNPNLYDCIIIPSHHGDCKHSIWLDHNPDYKLLCNIHRNQHDGGLFDGSSPYGDIYDCRTDGDTNYGVLIWRHIYHILSRHGHGNYVDSRLNRHFHLRLVCHKHIRFLCNFDDHTAYDGRLHTGQLLWSNDHCSCFDGKNHRANDDCINSASIDCYPNSANDCRLHVPLDNPGHRDLYNAVFLSIHIHACQHCFWLYHHGNFGSLSNDHPNITPSIDCREHRLFNNRIYPNSIRTNSGFNGDLYHELRFDLSDIISGDNNIGSTVTTESISYATSTERTTIVSSYISTATETTTASGPTQTVSGPTQTLLGPTQTESGPTQTISGPTQTVSGPTQTQVITTSYVETYTTSYPVTETLPGSTEVTISYATTTVERTVVSSYISTERISVTQTQEVTTTQAASTLYGTTTQPGVTIYGTVTATHERFDRHSARIFVDQ